VTGGIRTVVFFIIVTIEINVRKFTIIESVAILLGDKTVCSRNATSSVGFRKRRAPPKKNTDRRGRGGRETYFVGALNDTVVYAASVRLAGGPFLLTNVKRTKYSTDFVWL